MTFPHRRIRSTYRACKIPDYSRDTPRAVLSDARIDTHLLRNSTRIWRTTNILASVSSYIREGIRTDLLSYKAHVTNAYTLLRDVHAREDVWAIASEAGSSQEKVLYGEADNARDPVGNRPV